MKHSSVMLSESIQALNIKADGIYIDATLGRGGHSAAILGKLKSGHLYAIDKDSSAISESAAILAAVGSNYSLIHDDFRNLKEIMTVYQLDKVEGILFDLGVSSPQFDDPGRGFSYRYEARLDMRMDQRQKLSAYEVVNFYAYEELVRIFTSYGEEKNARAIARAIEKARIVAPITTTLELVEVIRSALPQKVLKKPGHPAKQVFQALRIEVNQELEILEAVLTTALQALAVNGRLAVITFHSLEDRIVKQLFQSYSRPPLVDKRILLKASELPAAKYELVSKKPLVASAEEIAENPRSKSAKLRVIRRLEE